MIPAQQAKQIEEKKHSPKKDKNNPEVFSRQEKTFRCSCRPWKTKIRTKLGSKPLFTVSVDFGRAILNLSGGFNGCSLIDLVSQKRKVASRELTYPTIGKWKIIDSNSTFWRGYVIVSWRVDLQNNQKILGLALTWRIIPFSTSLIAMVNKSPK